MNQMENVQIISDNLLCNGCGTCYSICPQSAITIDKNAKTGILFAHVNTEKCTHCGLCFMVCHSKSLLLGILPKKPDLIGDYNAIYTGYATNTAIRHRASSGGIVSATLHYLKENNLIDGFVLIKPSFESPLENVSFVSHDIEDILRYSGTRYFPIPVNKILIELDQMKGKYVIIGTPCQMLSLRKYEELNKSIKEKIFLKISFFCGGVPNFNAHKYYMQQHGIDQSRVRSIYRAIGWPGNNVFELDNGSTIKIPKRPKKFKEKIIHTLAFFPVFNQKRCLLCLDHYGGESDISVGDAWLKEYGTDETGVSLIISRNSFADKILLDMQNNNILFLEKGDNNQLIRSQLIFSDFFNNFPTSCRFLLGKKYVFEHFPNEQRKINWIWGMKISLLNFGMKYSSIKKLWPFLFIYGIFFYYGYYFLNIIESLMKK